ncbi:AAA family ATPase [Salmonella enterica]|nr:chromosome partitioning protein [Salmonella enterica]EBD7299100.1 chromosome partitioning protein [Salmonella enterica subsp. enterica]ECB7828308.1 chromosome partitioning protein [Salmonella enterica subsp. enterica serovar Jodhpur]ECJ6063550.1 AAA family ATPase [Salmonella enterica]ECP7743934.1 AAA family ATPase [Salmonella enterica subsp. enterica serovar Jodhpur]
MAKVISMINWKGGVGKSTLTLHLGVGLMRNSDEHPKVLLIDLDPQSNLSYLSLGVDDYVKYVYTDKKPTLKNIFDNYFDGKPFDTKQAIVKNAIHSSPGRVWVNVDLLPSHHELVLVDMMLAREKKSAASHQKETELELEKMAIIKHAIEQVSDEYDYILLDCPPNINLVTQNAFFASELYLIPAIPDFLSTVGISLIKTEMEKLNTNFRGMIQYSNSSIDFTDTEMLGIIFNMVDEYDKKPKGTHEGTISDVKTQNPGMVFEKYITDGDGISVAAENNLTVYSYDHLPRSKANAEKQSNYFEEVVSELCEKLEDL